MSQEIYPFVKLGQRLDVQLILFVSESYEETLSAN
jgi:hypothetical protein